MSLPINTSARYAAELYFLIGQRGGTQGYALSLRRLPRLLNKPVAKQVCTPAATAIQFYGRPS
jgi:hypothetical protein